jgi:hypothetical protein
MAICQMPTDPTGRWLPLRRMITEMWTTEVPATASLWRRFRSQSGPKRRIRLPDAMMEEYNAPWRQIGLHRETETTGRAHRRRLRTSRGFSGHERRVWATVNKETGGGKKSGSGRGKPANHAPSRKGGKLRQQLHGSRGTFRICDEGSRGAQTESRSRLIGLTMSVGPAGGCHEAQPVISKCEITYRSQQLQFCTIRPRDRMSN